MFSRNKKNADNVLCRVSEEYLEELPINPQLLEDYYVNSDDSVTFGREKHYYLDEQLVEQQSPLNIDLKEGLEDYKPDERPDEGLKQMETYLLQCAEKLDYHDLKTITKGANVICQRGSLSRIAASPYEKDGVGWKFIVEKFDGVLFLNKVHTEERINIQNNLLGNKKKKEIRELQLYYGIKFERIIAPGRLGKMDNDSPEARRISSWGGMYASFLSIFPGSPIQKELKLFYTAQMDGLDHRGNHIESKVHLNGRCENDKYFSHNALKCSIQCQLAGIKDVIVGSAHKGVLNSVEKKKLVDLEKECGDLNANICFGAVKRVLNHVLEQYDRLVEPGELLVIERKRNETEITYSVAESAPSKQPWGAGCNPKPRFNSILSETFKHQFTEYKQLQIQALQAIQLWQTLFVATHVILLLGLLILGIAIEICEHFGPTTTFLLLLLACYWKLRKSSPFSCHSANIFSESFSKVNRWISSFYDYQILPKVFSLTETLSKQMPEKDHSHLSQVRLTFAFLHSDE